MECFYHRRASGFRGSTIYPLNALREMFPDLYVSESAKYEGRASITHETVPLVDALWNDLVHCAPAHPYVVHEALTTAGVSPGPGEFFKIPVTKLADSQAVWFDPQNERYPFPVRPQDIHLIVPEEYRELTMLPERTLKYYRSCVTRGQSPSLLFLYVPHVLVLGALDVSDVEVVDWEMPL